MASLAPKSPEPIIPSEKDMMLAKQSSRMLAAHLPETESVRLHLPEDGTEIVVPASALRFLMDVLAQMAKGNAVTLIPIHAEMTTQQAADFLNVSRPYLINEVLDKGKVPFRRLGTHRRILFEDLMTFKKESEVQSRKAFRELTQQAQELDLGY